jgi:membrane associated rhomboid family serine protease
VASFGHVWFNWDSTIPAVGASGAIAAIMGAYIVLFPQSRIKMLFLIFPFTIPAVLFLGFWIFSQVSSGVAGLAVETADTADVAWWAHIIGFAFGVLGGLYWRMQGALKGSYFEHREIYV